MPSSLFKNSNSREAIKIYSNCFSPSRVVRTCAEELLKIVPSCFPLLFVSLVVSTYNTLHRQSMDSILFFLSISFPLVALFCLLLSTNIKGLLLLCHLSPRWNYWLADIQERCLWSTWYIFPVCQEAADNRSLTAHLTSFVFTTNAFHYIVLPWLFLREIVTCFRVQNRIRISSVWHILHFFSSHKVLHNAKHVLFMFLDNCVLIVTRPHDCLPGAHNACLRTLVSHSRHLPP